MSNKIRIPLIGIAMISFLFAFFHLDGQLDRMDHEITICSP
jgi:hypothetical protein